MAIAWKKRLHRNYCDIVIQSHPCQLVQPFVSQLARTSYREILKRAVLKTKGTQDYGWNNTANKIKTLLFPFLPVLRVYLPVKYST